MWRRLWRGRHPVAAAQGSRPWQLGHRAAARPREGGSRGGAPYSAPGGGGCGTDAQVAARSVLVSQRSRARAERR